MKRYLPFKRGDKAMNAAIYRHLASFVAPDEECIVEFKVTKVGKKRQYAYWYGVVLDTIGSKFGWKPSEYQVLHRFFKAMFLAPEYDSVTEISSGEMAELIHKTIDWAREYDNIVIPLPNENE